MANHGTTLAIRCTPAEAEAIREAAKQERRTITGFVMNAVMTRLAYQGRLQQRRQPDRGDATRNRAEASRFAHEEALAVDNPHWRVLLVGLAQHRALIQKLLTEGHEVEATDIFAKAYLHIAANDYDMIIVDADDDPAGTDAFCKWIAEKRVEAKVIRLTRWRETTGNPKTPNITKIDSF